VRYGKGLSSREIAGFNQVTLISVSSLAVLQAAD